MVECYQYFMLTHHSTATPLCNRLIFIHNLLNSKSRIVVASYVRCDCTVFYILISIDQISVEKTIQNEIDYNFSVALFCPIDKMSKVYGHSAKFTIFCHHNIYHCLNWPKSKFYENFFVFVQIIIDGVNNRHQL